MCENFGMAKYLNGKVRITLEQNNTVSVFESENVSMSSTPGGLGVNIGINYAKKVDTTSCAKVEGYTRDERPLCEAPQSPEEQEMIAAAKNRELSVLQAAKIVADAHREAERRIENADHKLNLAIQGYLHTGQGNVTASKVLEKSGIWASEDRTAAVACAELDKLYGVDTLNSGL